MNNYFLATWQGRRFSLSRSFRKIRKMTLELRSYHNKPSRMEPKNLCSRTHPTYLHKYFSKQTAQDTRHMEQRLIFALLARSFIQTQGITFAIKYYLSYEVKQESGSKLKIVKSSTTNVYLTWHFHEQRGIERSTYNKIK